MAHTIINDPFLQSVLKISTQTRQQTMDLIDFTSANAVSATVSPHHHHHQNLNDNSNNNSTSDNPKQQQPPSSPPDHQLELTKQQRMLYAHLGELRSLNRNAILQVRETKQTTAEARQEIDCLHLRLQNLYYEERHLRGEIAACESYEYV